MASTWTEEQGIKFDRAWAEAADSSLGLDSDALFTFDSAEFWEYIAQKVGDGKTTQDCKDYLDENNKDINKGILSSTWTEEEVTKCRDAIVHASRFGSLTVGTCEFWECVAKEVDSVKTWKECRELHAKGFAFPRNMKSDDDKK